MEAVILPQARSQKNNSSQKESVTNFNNARVDVIIPAFNEESSIVKVLKDIPTELVNNVIVVNNASTDLTENYAKKNGAVVLKEHRKGYGRTCLRGIDYLASKPEDAQPDIVVFLDADYSDYPEEMELLLLPIIKENYDFVVGSRRLGKRESRSMLPQAIIGNYLATTLIRWLYGAKFTDLGPFRAIKFNKLLELNMQDKDFGWTAEMQVKAAKKQYKCTEVPVSYRRRIGVSKITGTVLGTIMAGYKILWTIFRYK